MIRGIVAVWRARWNLLRWLVAAFLLWIALADTGARLARLQLAGMPGYDASPEIASLRAQSRYGEAMILADAAIERAEAAHADAPRLAALRRERDLTAAEQSSLLRRVHDLGRGALTGGAGVEPGAVSVEVLVGAVATDMLVVGDVRDLIVQGYDYAVDGKADPVIVALSAIGLALTLAPEIDWAPSVLKVARKVGTLGERLGGFIVKALKGGRVRELKPLLEDAASIARHSSPGSAVRMLRLAQTPEDVARIARFLEREGRAGAAALHVTGEAGADALRTAEGLRAAGRIEEASRLESLVVKAAGKGEAGASWLRRAGYRVLLRPHPLVGLLKGVYKGNVSALVQRALEMLDARAWWIVPLLAAWLVLESGLLLGSMSDVRRRTPDVRSGLACPSSDIRHPTPATPSPRA